MNDDYELNSAVLKLIFKNYSQKKTIIKDIKKLLIINDQIEENVFQ